MMFPKKFEILYEFKLGYDAVAADQNTAFNNKLTKYFDDILFVITNLLFLFHHKLFLNQKKNTFAKSEFYQFFRKPPMPDTHCTFHRLYLVRLMLSIAGRSNTSVTQSRSISTERAFIPRDMQFANEQEIRVTPLDPCRNSNLVECRVQGSSRASSLVRDDWFSLCRPS